MTRTRRSVLCSLVPALGTAGCVASDASEGGTETRTTPSSPAETAAPATGAPQTTTGPGEVRTTIETTGSACGTDASVSFSWSESSVLITGTLVASDPCHAVAVADAAVRDGTLEVRLAPERSDGGLCAQCIAGIDFALCATFPGQRPTEAVVVLDGHERERVSSTRPTDTATTP